MKRLLFSIICILLTTLAVNAQGLVFDKTTHNFGAVEESGGKVSHTFNYTNTSAEPIVIVDVAVSCGCTTPRFSREPIAAGAKGKISIEFDPMNRPGRINKEAHVVTNAGNYKLTIDGTVNPRPRSLVERYPFITTGGARLDGLGYFSLQVPMASEITAEVGIANGNPAIPVMISIDKSQLPSNITASVSKELLTAGEEAKIQITVRGAHYGAFSHRIPLIINGSKTAETITIGGSVIDDFSKLSDAQLMSPPRAKFSTFYHRFGSVKSGSQNKAVINITNIGQSTLIIRGIEGSVQVDARTDRTSIEPGQSAKLTINYSQSQKGYDSGLVRLIVNDPRNPTPEVRFVATVE